MTSMNVFLPDGSPCSLGRKLGAGGEGAVYEVQYQGTQLAAKVYHRPITPDKQHKLIKMATQCDDALKKIATWPITTLHQRQEGAVCGFLMPKINDYEAIHKLYGPAHRKQTFPNADWAFLVNAARNMAAAFDVIHAHGHVVADVNQGNVVVATNSMTKLIDCDSFQILIGNDRYLCDVGVAHFTPPELQSLKTFHGFQRTPNHDNFGLALLCFHLLFMGRHPFSGVYSGKEDMPIERAIREFRFSFSRGASAKGMKPPPDSIGLETVSPQVAALFEAAFSEAGAYSQGRPKAIDWVRTLDILKSDIRTCQVESVHKFFGGLKSCPWCALERRSGVLFFIGVIPSSSLGGAFNLDYVWHQIGNVPSPGEAPVIDPLAYSPQPKPLPAGLHVSKVWFYIRKTVAISIVLLCLTSFPSAFFIVLIIALYLFFGAKIDDSQERGERRSAVILAQSKWKEEEQRWKMEAGDGEFKKKYGEALKLKNVYENLNNEYAKEKQNLQARVKELQLNKFLEKYFIADYSIPRIGVGRKATLASFGIETAKDIEKNRIMAINGFGESLSYELIQWRKQLENRFVYDSAKGIEPSDVAALDQKYRQRRKQIEGSLLATPELLNKIRKETLLKRSAMRSRIESAAISLAQANADMNLLK